MNTVDRFTRNVPQKRRAYRNTRPGVKWCPHCRSDLAVGLFGLDVSRDDGLSGWCRRCRARGEKKRRDADLVAARAGCVARYQRNPDLHKAHVAVSRAIARGNLVKPKLCPVCCKPRRIEAHHHAGYDRANWLNVVWRCRQCHKLEHTRGVVAPAIAA